MLKVFPILLSIQMALSALPVLGASLPAMNESKVKTPTAALPPGHTPQDRASVVKEHKAAAREWRKALRSAWREMKKQDDVDDRTVLLAVIAIFLPPLAVFLKDGEITGRFWLSLLLSLLFWIPGVVYSLLVVFDVV